VPLKNPPAIRITLVSYQQPAQIRPYEPTRIGAEAQVGEGDNPADALEALRAFVHEALAVETQRQNGPTEREALQEFLKDIGPDKPKLRSRRPKP